MHSHTLIFIQDLAFIMLIAGISTVMCRLFKQPIVLGYIIAGVVIGPHTPPFNFISDENTIKTLAEMGVIFLMFSLGLEFNLHKLSKVGLVALIAAIFEILLMLGVGYEVGRLFGWSNINAIFLGAILSISSTTIIVKALTELGMKKEPFAQLIFGILIIEDLFAILILALLSSIAIKGTLPFYEFMLTTTKLFSFLIISLIVGILIVPRLLSYIGNFKSNEMLLISVLGLCFGFSLLVMKLNYSVALGAFIIGAIMAESDELIKIEHLIAPLRDMFSAIFFVSVGLLFDFTILKTYWLPIIIITLVVIIGKVFSCSLGVLITGRHAKTAMRTGLGLAQIGEFSFIIASLGLTLNVTGAFLYSIAVSVSIITTLLTPYFIRYSDAITNQIGDWMPKKIVYIFGLYVAWLQNIRPNQEKEALNHILKNLFFHVVVNLFIVIAIFLTGAFVAKTHLGELLTQATNLYLQKTIIWVLALILSLPFLIAVYRKLKAFSMILAELSVKERVATRLDIKVRKIIAEVIPIIALLGILFFIFTLSISILPPIELLLLVFILAIVLMPSLYPYMVKLQAKLQLSLLQSLKKRRSKNKSP